MHRRGRPCGHRCVAHSERSASRGDRNGTRDPRFGIAVARDRGGAADSDRDRYLDGCNNPAGDPYGGRDSCRDAGADASCDESANSCSVRDVRRRSEDRRSGHCPGHVSDSCGARTQLFLAANRGERPSRRERIPTRPHDRHDRSDRPVLPLAGLPNVDPGSLPTEVADLTVRSRHLLRRHRGCAGNVARKRGRDSHMHVGAPVWLRQRRWFRH